MIKIEYDSMGTGSESNDNLLKLLTNFHDQDSEICEIKHQDCNYPSIPLQTQFLMNTINDIFDIRVTPLKDIEKYISTNYIVNDDDLQRISSRILKKKLIMKRQRAKNRSLYKQLIKIQQNTPLDIIDLIKIETPSDELQKKKKRNRISAQISRDRKKQYLYELEKQNKKLVQQAQYTKRQNQTLKEKIIECQNLHDNKKQTSFKFFEGKARFFKLMIVLGLVFFLSIFKDIFKASYSSSKPNSNKTVTLTKQEQNGLMDGVCNLCTQQFSTNEELRYEIINKISKLKKKNTNLIIPSTIYQQIRYTSNDCFK